MKTLKKNNISQWSSVNKDCELPPFFNEDYFGHVVVQTIEELNSIPCKLRQDGMLATVVQDSYAEWQLQSSRIGFSKCDNRSWVKINSGDTFYDGSNLFIFPTQAEADIYKSTPAVKEGQVIYIIETNTYFKYDGQDAYVDPFPNKLTVPTEDGVEGPDYKVPAYLADGAPYWRSTKDFGKVKSVNGKEGDVILKTSELENDSDYTTNSTLTAHTSNKTNPHNVTKSQIGLGNIDNTSDLDKPISTATQNALNEKADDNMVVHIEGGEIIVGDKTFNKPITSPTSPTDNFHLTNKVYVDSKIENIKIKDPEFVKNGVGWSLKYRADNPTFYGAIGPEAVDFSVSKSVNTVMQERFSYGANGFNSAVFGIYNSAMDAGSLVSGAQNRSQGQCNNIMSSNSTIIQDKGTGNFIKKDNGIYSGSNNTIENNRNSTVIGGGYNRMVGKISPVNNMYDMYNAIIGGNNNTLTNSISNIILGGTLNNIIGEEKSRENGSYNSNNAIIGGYKNKIITATGINRQAYSSVIFGGEENIAQGFYNMVAGYGNHAVTVGEVLTGIYGTVQNTSLSGYDFISDSRMFNVGIGESTTQGVVTRKDGLSVFRNGLVTAPRLTTSLIENNSKAVTTKEFVDSKISNFKLPTNWESPQQKFSGLEDKSADATYNQLLGVDSNGYVAKVGLNAVTNAMAKSSDAQKDDFRLASRKSTETYSIGQPRIDYILPNLIANNRDEITYVSVVGLNLLLNLQDCEVKLINTVTNQEYLVSVIQTLAQSSSMFSFGFNFYNKPVGNYRIFVRNGILTNIDTTVFTLVESISTEPLAVNFNKYFKEGLSEAYKNTFTTGVNYISKNRDTQALGNTPIADFVSKTPVVIDPAKDFVFTCLFSLNTSASGYLGDAQLGLTQGFVENIYNTVQYGVRYNFVSLISSLTSKTLVSGLLNSNKQIQIQIIKRGSMLSIVTSVDGVYSSDVSAVNIVNPLYFIFKNNSGNDLAYITPNPIVINLLSLQYLN